MGEKHPVVTLKTKHKTLIWNSKTLLYSDLLWQVELSGEEGVDYINRNMMQSRTMSFRH